MQLFAAEDYPGALAAFQRSYALVPKPSVLYNLAMCYKALYRYVDAIATFQRYLLLGSNRIQPSRLDEVKSEISEMKRLIGKLNVLHAPPDSEVLVDGKPVGKTPLVLPLEIDPGKHVVKLTKTGYQPFIKELTVASGSEIKLEVELKLQAAGIRVECNTVGATVQIDDQVLGACPYNGQVTPGRHELLVTASGKKNYQSHITVSPGSTAVVSVVLESDEHAKVSEPPAHKAHKRERVYASSGQPDRGASALFIGGIVSIVLGAGAAAVAGYFTYKGYQDEQEAEEILAQAGKDTVDAETLKDLGRDYRKIREEKLPSDSFWSIGGYTLASVLIAAGIVTLVLDDRENDSNSSKKLIARPNALVVNF